MGHYVVTPYWSTFAEDPQSSYFTCVNNINEWEIISRSLLGGYILCGHKHKRQMCIFMNDESPSTILRNGKPDWKQVAMVEDSSFELMRGVFGAQFDLPEPLGNLVVCPKIGISILFDRLDKVPAVFRVDISWGDKGSATPDVQTGWATSIVGNDPELALVCDALQTRIDEQINGIRAFMKENGSSIPWDEEKIVGKYSRVDFVWKPAAAIAARVIEEDVQGEALKIVQVKRGRPAGKLDSAKRTRGPAMKSSLKIECMITAIKLFMLFPDSEVREFTGIIAGLFTLTTAFLDFDKWKTSEPLERKFKALVDEVTPMLNDNTYGFTQDYSSELRQKTQRSTMEAYDQCGGRIRAWCADGSKFDYFRNGLVSGSLSDPLWYDTNKRTLQAMGVKSLNALLSAERAKKQCKGVAVAAVVVGCDEEEDMSWNLLVEAKQELRWGREDAEAGMKEYYASMGEMSHEEMTRKANHVSEVYTGFEKVGTKLNEAISIFKEDKRLKRQLDALNARKQGLKGELNVLVQNLVGLTDFCPPGEVQSKAGGALFIKQAVDGILDN